MVSSSLVSLSASRRVTGLAGRAAEDHSQCQSQQHLSDDLLEETVSESPFREKRTTSERTARNR